MIKGRFSFVMKRCLINSRRSPKELGIVNVFGIFIVEMLAVSFMGFEGDLLSSVGTVATVGLFVLEPDLVGDWFLSFLFALVFSLLIY